MVVYLITAVLLLLYLVLVWFLGTWFHLQAPDIWILRGGLAVVGIAAAVVILWFHRKSKKVQQGEEQVKAQQGIEEIDRLVHEALDALRKSTLGRGATLRNQPLIFFVGEPGSAKTNVIIHSGLDPELLAGQVYQDNNVLTTRIANVWYTQSAILVDAAGVLLQQAAHWKRLVQLVRPGPASSALSTSQQAPRAAVICFDSANFLKPGAGEATLSSARKLSARLHDVTQMLGISLPIYVLFTKLDRLQGFTEFARTLNPNEAAQVLGATMPIRSLRSGVYADEETKRLSATFDELFFSLADKRLDLLARENDTDSLPSIYEFPRELRKLRTLLVQFLVELARPSRLSVNPFLRGFYFSGVRPLFVEDGVSAAPQASVPDGRLDGGATQVFSSPVAQPAAAVAVRSSGRRKVPQWTFLPRLFNEIIVKDRVALSASGVSSKVNFIRRFAWIAATVISVIFIAGFLVSYLGNRQLEANVQAAATEVQQLRANPQQIPSVGDLQKLDRLRQELRTLATYQTDGVPWHLRWFLYVGEKIRPDAHRIYFSAFRQLLFDNAEGIILSDLRRLPDQPGPRDAYDPVYDELKTHLITAQYYDKCTRDFPAPVLTKRWSDVNKPDPERLQLAQRQFDYYGAELRFGDPIGNKPDDAAIARARNYLGKFGGVDRVYRPLIDLASRAAADAVFYAKFPDASGVIVSNHSVKGAYTPAGFQAFSAAIHDLSRSLAGEEWVLGKQTASALDQATLQQQLMQRYQQDFVKEWRTLLQSSYVPQYKDVDDADQKLDRLVSPSSPLLELLWFVATNTNIDNVRDTFASVDLLEPPGAPDKQPDQLRQPANQNYVQALTNLQGTVHILAQAGTSDANASAAVMTAAAQAKGAASLAGSKVDNQYHTEQLTQQLLEQPIRNVEQVVQKSPAQDLNAGGKSLCDQFGQMAQVFPFKVSAKEELTIEKFNGFFAPKTGALWTFYDKQLSKYVAKEGSRYKSSPTAPFPINPGFLNFFSRMATVTDAFYPNNSPPPSVAYSLTVQPNNVDKLILTIDNIVLSQTGESKMVNWNGSPQEVRVTSDKLTLRQYGGSWAVVRLVQSGTDVLHSYSDLRWNVLQSDGTPVTVNGQQQFYSYKLQTGSPNPFELVTSPGVRCDPKVALTKP